MMRMITFVYLYNIVLFNFFNDASADSCPIGIISGDDDNVCLWITTTPGSHSESEEICKENDGNLLYIPHQESWNELTYVFQNTLSHQWFGGLWIGITDKKQEGSYKTMDGSRAHFLKWKNGEPDDVNHSLNCVKILPWHPTQPFHYDDRNCSEESFGICGSETDSDPGIFHMTAAHMTSSNKTEGRTSSITTKYMTSASVASTDTPTPDAPDTVSLVSNIEGNQNQETESSTTRTFTSTETASYSSPGSSSSFTTHSLSSESTENNRYRLSSVETPISTTAMNKITDEVTNGLTEMTSLFRKATANNITSSYTTKDMTSASLSVTSTDVSTPDTPDTVNLESTTERNQNQETESSITGILTSTDEVPHSSSQNSFSLSTHLPSSGSTQSNKYRLSSVDTPVSMTTLHQLTDEVTTGLTEMTSAFRKVTALTTDVVQTKNKTCWCVCKKNNMSEEELERRIQEVAELLSIPKKSTSASKRKLISAYDDRQSAKHLGYFGASILLGIAGFIILLDLTSCFDQVSFLKNNHQKVRHKLPLTARYHASGSFLRNKYRR